MTRLLILSVLLVLMVHSAVYAEVVDKIVAVVNDEIITRKDLEDFKKQLQKGKFVDDLMIKDKVTLLKDDKALLRQMIDEKIIDSEVKHQDLAVTVEKVDQEIRRVTDQNRMSRQQLVDELKKQGVSFSEYQAFMKQRLERQALIQKAISSKIRISEEEIQNYYLSTYGNKNLTAYEYSIAHILFRPKGGDKDAAKERAAAVSTKLKAGEDFDKLATQYSEDPNFTQGGFLGSFKNGEFLKELEAAVANMNPGQYSDVIQSKLGYHILKLLSKNITKDPVYESKKKDIQNILYEKAFAQQFKFWVEQKKSESFIRIN